MTERLNWTVLRPFIMQISFTRLSREQCMLSVPGRVIFFFPCVQKIAPSLHCLSKTQIQTVTLKMSGWGTIINTWFHELLEAGEGAVPPEEAGVLFPEEGEGGGWAELTPRLRSENFPSCEAAAVVVYLWLPLSCVPLQACLICLSYLCIFT